ncbi:hypothetical protein H5410_001681 [Solanum commersonii]|uniref:DNA topoisomerase VI subunit B transducer domain-containing protein n=1 Tax=Solanum commersonii TaxID=4109 RepID=A0A9J6AZU6_SOLCO|nr:hypothetical protein H5410_001681 [Solanum commersonii]
MGPDFSPKMSVKSLTPQQIVRIHQLFRQAKFDDPSGDILSPAGEYNLRLGIIKELHPDMVATFSGSAQVFEGHPFIVEAGVSVGGKDVKQICSPVNQTDKISIASVFRAVLVGHMNLCCKYCPWSLPYSSYSVAYSIFLTGGIAKVKKQKIPKNWMQIFSWGVANKPERQQPERRENREMCAEGLNVFRFANRIPLLFEQGADVVTRTAMKRINYKINQTLDKIGVFVSIVSTKIPFKGTGKEYIGDDISEIASAVKTAIQQCCNQLKSKIVKRIHAREQQERKRNLSKYIPSATAAIYDLLKQTTIVHASKKRRFRDDNADLLKQVSVNSLTKDTFREKLAQHVEKMLFLPLEFDKESGSMNLIAAVKLEIEMVDYEMGLEYATQTGVNEEPREDIYIESLDEDKKNFIDLQSPIFVFRLYN